MPMTNRRALFLDRDGTIIEDVGYARDPRQVRLLPGAGSALAELGGKGFLLILVSNQSGVGRGWITPEQAEQVHRQLLSSLAQREVRLAAAYYCPHAPAEHCRCRKPSPGMLLHAAKEFGLELKDSYLVGDKPSDIDAGSRVGCRTILLAPAGNPPGGGPAPDYVAVDWSEIRKHLLREVGVTA